MIQDGLFMPVDKGEIVVHEPKRPTLRRLTQLYGEPPWQLVITDEFGIIPQEATELVGSLVWRGVEFKKTMGEGGCS